MTPFPAAVPDTRSVPWAERVELTYARTLLRGAEAAASAESQAETPQNQALPAWAQNVLRKNGGQAPSMGNAQPFAPNGQSAAPNGQISWSAPFALPAAVPHPPGANAPHAPSPMVYRERKAGEQEQTFRAQESEERTVRRLADKVYRMIEERLRKELRRGGK